MAKTSGLGFQVQVDTEADSLTDISNDVSNFSFATPRAVNDITGVDKSAMERQLLLADFSLTLNGIFNAALSHTVFETVPSGSLVRDTDLTLGSDALDNDCLFTDYAITRAANGALTWAAPAALADGVVPTWA
jgi:hypothetical protein